MKRFLFTLLCLASILPAAFAQEVDRTKVPEPGPAPKINIADAKTFTLKNGLKVYVVENDKRPTLSISLSFFLDPLVEGDIAGVTSAVGQVMEAGTTERTKEELDEAVDFLGASLNVSSSGIYAFSLKSHQDEILDIMTEVLYKPLMPESELEKFKKTQLSNLANAKDNPDAISGKLSSVLLYGKDHPYGEQISEETINNITIDDVKNYYHTYFKPNVASLVLVGDINVKEAKKLAKKYFGKWAKGDVPSYTYDAPKEASETTVDLVHRPSSVQSVISITHVIPSYTVASEDRAVVSVLNQILGGGSSSRLFRNLREDKAYTYGAYSRFNASRLSGVFSASASVRNAVTDSAIVEFFNEFKSIREEKVTDEELNNAKASLIGSFSRSLENAQTIANFALNIDRYNFPKDYYKNYLKRINSITKEDVLNAAKKYIKPDQAHIVVVTNALEVAPSLEKFGKITYYDADAEVTKAPTKGGASDITKDALFNNYVEALGGKANVMALEDIKLAGSATVQGQTLKFKMTYQMPGSFNQTVNMSGMEFMVQKINPEGVKIVQAGRDVPLPQEMEEDAIFEGMYLPEVYAAEKLELGETAEYKGNMCYTVTYKGNASEFTFYYDKETFLKVGTKKVVNTPMGSQTVETQFDEYKEFNGVQIPTVYLSTVGPAPVRIEMTDIKVNTGADPSLFK